MAFILPHPCCLRNEWVIAAERTAVTDPIVSLNRAAEQSSTNSTGTAGLAVDGDLGNLAVTNSSLNPWW